jgi:hypothetical protein
MVEHLLCKCEAQSSNANLTKRKEIPNTIPKIFGALFKHQACQSVAHASIYSGGRDQEDGGTKTGQANSSQDPILKISCTKKELVE